MPGFSFVSQVSWLAATLFYIYNSYLSIFPRALRDT